MMRETPRTFVGSVVFELETRPCTHLVDAVQTEIAHLPAIGRCQLDVDAGTLVVTARTPIDRADIVAVLDRLGCRVRT